MNPGRRSSVILSQFDYTVKIILLGDHSVGKTSFLTQLATSDGKGDAPHCRCLDFQQNCHVELEVQRHGKRILVKIADTGGQERFRSITASYYRGAQGCLVMFDAERPDTFSHVIHWNSDLEMYTNNQFLSKFLVGVNLNSSRKQVTADQATRLATQLEMQFHELDTGNRKSAVTIVASLLDLVMLHVTRMPSLTIDILPGHVKPDVRSLGGQNRHDERGRRGRRSTASTLEESFSSWDDPPQKFKCFC